MVSWGDFWKPLFWFYTFHVVLEELCRMPGLQTSLFKTATQKCFAEFCVVFCVPWCFFQQFVVFWEPLSAKTQDLKTVLFFAKNETCSFNIHLWRVLFYLFKKRWTWPGCVWMCNRWWMQVWKKLQVLQVPVAVWRLVTIENFSRKKKLLSKTPLKFEFWVELPSPWKNVLWKHPAK